MIRFLASFTIAVLLSAQDKPPVVPADIEAEFYRTDGVVARLNLQAQQLQIAMQKAQADNQKATDEVVKFCGKDYTVQPTDKHLLCVKGDKK